MSFFERFRRPKEEPRMAPDMETVHPKEPRRESPLSAVPTPETREQVVERLLSEAPNLELVKEEDPERFWGSEIKRELEQAQRDYILLYGEKGKHLSPEERAEIELRQDNRLKKLEQSRVDTSRFQRPFRS